MASIVHQERFSARRPVPLPRRIATLALVVAIHVAILWLLLRIAPSVMSPPPGPESTLVVDMLPADQVAPAAAPAKQVQRKAAAGSASTAPPVTAVAPPPDVPPPPPVPTTPSDDVWSKVIPMTGRDFARAAITSGTRSTSEGAGRSNAAGDSGDGDADTDAGGGSGGGERLYAADWYRRPTHAELSTYLPRNAQPGWGEVACRTIPNNQVTDCREIGQSGRGSGLAGAVRQAAWQFRILPPRVGGKPLIGSWVRIRITYTDAGATVE